MSGQFCPNPEYWNQQVKRYLYARIDAEWRNDPLEARKAVGRFLEALTLSEGDLDWLARVYHIVQAHGAHEFVVDILKDSLSSLTRERKSQITVRKAVARGRVLWERTLKIQRARADPTVYIAEESSKTPDTPENRLLKKYLQALVDCKPPVEAGSKTSTARKVVEVFRVANELLGSVFLRDISLVPRVTARMLARARRSKHRVYAKVSQLWAEFESAVLLRDVDVLKDVLARGWLAPKMEEDTDSLFQLFVLVSILEALEEMVLQERGNVKFGLVRSDGPAAVAVYEGPVWRAEVYYDKAPSVALGFEGGGSFYIRITELFRGLSGAPRRPDVSVRLTDGRSNEVKVIVEAKNTDPTSRYGSDSIYKALGYLRDYEGLWPEHQHPKFTLVYPGGTAPVSEDSLTAEDLAIVSGDLTPQFKLIFGRLIGHTG